MYSEWTRILLTSWQRKRSWKTYQRNADHKFFIVFDSRQWYCGTSGRWNCHSQKFNFYKSKNIKFFEFTAETLLLHLHETVYIICLRQHLQNNLSRTAWTCLVQMNEESCEEFCNGETDRSLLERFKGQGRDTQNEKCRGQSQQNGAYRYFSRLHSYWTIYGKEEY